VGGSGAARPATPSKPKPARVTKKAQTTPIKKKTTTKKVAAAKAAAIKEQLEDESDEGMGKKAAVKAKGGDEEMGDLGMLSSE
jgi:hypothetical protein